MSISRRQFNSLLLAGTSAITAPVSVTGQAKAKVVVIGGGAGGATAARYLARDGKGELHVTLIESSVSYTSCFYSNLYIGGFRSFSSITHSYDSLASDYDINIVQVTLQRLTVTNRWSS